MKRTWIGMVTLAVVVTGSLVLSGCKKAAPKDSEESVPTSESTSGAKTSPESAPGAKSDSGGTGGSTLSGNGQGGSLSGSGSGTSSIPVDLSNPSRSKFVSAGENTTCSVGEDLRVRCWGSNDAKASAVHEIAGLAGEFKTVATSGAHACALQVNGALFCWGANENGQLGDGSAKSRETPAQVALAGVVQVVLGSHHTCALTSDGAVYCWGDHSSGQLGIGKAKSSSTPVEVSALTEKVVHLTAAQKRTCALTVDGAVKCWGEIVPGKSGFGTSKKVPTQIPGLSGEVATVEAGGRQICAVTQAGVLKCWGESLLPSKWFDSIQDIFSFTPDPQAVTGFDHSVAQIAAGPSQVCVQKAKEGTYCLNGTKEGMSEVSAITGPATQLAVGAAHACALMESGELRCWGDNASGQLGPGQIEKAQLK